MTVSIKGTPGRSMLASAVAAAIVVALVMTPTAAHANDDELPAPAQMTGLPAEAKPDDRHPNVGRRGRACPRNSRIRYSRSSVSSWYRGWQQRPWSCAQGI